VLEDAQNLIMAERERWQMADAEVKKRMGVAYLLTFHSIHALSVRIESQRLSSHKGMADILVLDLRNVQRELQVTQYKEAVAGRLAEANAKCLQLMGRIATLERQVPPAKN
jgi:hypothetical protein